MGQTIQQRVGPAIYHVNFHTFRNHPVFESLDYLTLAEEALRDVLSHWAIPCIAWTVMPTPIHLIVVTFPDQQLGKILNLIKGRTSRGILDAAPELRGNLGNHLWQEGYHWVLIKDQRQCANTIRYIRENRRKGGLE